jgi:hypothetical protein
MTAKTRLTLVAGAGLLCVPMLALAEDQIQGYPGSVGTLVLAGMALLFVLAVLALSLYSAARRHQSRLELIERLLDKGQPVPSELLRWPDDPMPEVQRRRDFRRGITLLCWALSAGLVLYELFNLRATAFALILVFLSAGSFLNWYLAARTTATGNELSAALARDR